MKPIYTLSKTAQHTTLTSFAAIALLSGSLAGSLAGCSNHQGNYSNASEAAGGAQSVSATTEAASSEQDAAASEDGAVHNAEAQGKEHGGVKTNHDIFHSKALEVPAGKPVPALTVRVDDDPVSGWNLYVGTANFTFTPADINGESGPTSGHANLYINEEPIQRIYGNWTHLPELPAGTNQIRVTLNANGHETLTTQGQPIEETVTVEVYDPDAP